MSIFPELSTTCTIRAGWNRSLELFPSCDMCETYYHGAAAQAKF